MLVLSSLALLDCALIGLTNGKRTCAGANNQIIVKCRHSNLTPEHFLCQASTSTWTQYQFEPNNHWNDSTPLGLVYICEPHCSSCGRGLAMNYSIYKDLLPSMPTFSSYLLDLLPVLLPLSTVLSSQTMTLSPFLPNVILLGDFNIHMHNNNVPLPKISHHALKVASTSALTFPSIQNGHSLGLFYCSGLTSSNSTAEELDYWNKI